MTAPVRRVLMTADTVGGVWTYALELSRGLVSRGIAVDLATMGAPLDAAQWRDARAVPGLRVFESRFKLEWMEEPWDDVARAGDWLLEVERASAPDLVHLNGYAHGSLPFRAPVLVVGHSCVLSWWRAVKGCDAGPEWRRYRDEVAAGLRAARMVAAPTAAMLEALRLHYGPLAAVRVIPNGRGEWRAGGFRKEPFVFTSGRLWDEGKNVAAVERVAGRIPWPVYAAGDGRGPRSGAPGREDCRFLGKLDPRAMQYWFARASLYVLPARYEPFGLSALEAALSGCALVLGDIPSLREVWDGAASYVPPGDTDALEAAIRDLIHSPEHRIEMAGRARERALGYSATRMLEEYLSAYAAVAA